MALQAKFWQGNFEPTTADDPRINAAQIIDTTTDAVVARASLVYSTWAVSFYGPQHAELAQAAGTRFPETTVDLVDMFTRIAEAVAA